MENPDMRTKMERKVLESKLQEYHGRTGEKTWYRIRRNEHKSLKWIWKGYVARMSQNKSAYAVTKEEEGEADKKKEKYGTRQLGNWRFHCGQEWQETLRGKEISIGLHSKTKEK